MSRSRYWLGAAMPLVVALTTMARADGASTELTDSLRFRGPLVSLTATNVTLPELARQMTAVLGCEVRIEGGASGTVSVDLSEVPVSKLLAQTQATLGGRWQTLYRVSTHDPASTPPPPSGTILDLNLPDASCQAAAVVVARMAGAHLERDGELTGQVSLVGTGMPVEQALDAIARAAKASWRRIYVMKLDALPQTASTHKAGAESKSDDAPGHKKPDAAPKLFSNHASAYGKPMKLTKRDWKHPTARTYADGIKPISPSLEDIQKQQMLGLYGNFFLLESESSRKSAMKSFQTGLESRLKRLEALPPSQRTVTTWMTRRDFQRLLDDFSNLDKDQKKEAQTLYDFAKEQLDKAPLKMP